MPRHAQNSRRSHASTESSGVFRRYHVANDPVNFADPFGLERYKIFEIYGTPEFIKNIKGAIDLIEKSKIGKEVITQIETDILKCDRLRAILIRKVNKRRTETDTQTNHILINPDQVTLVNTRDGGGHVLALDETLLHEFGHVIGYSASLRDELTIIHKIDNKYSKETGRPERDTYNLNPSPYERRLMDSIRKMK